MNDFLCGILFGAILMMALDIFLIDPVQIRKWNEVAVQNGVAEYTVNKKTGEVSFTWVVPKSEQGKSEPESAK